MYEHQGYSYVPAVDMLQPGIDLNREEAAARDIFRMRMMPKSPREDAILLEIAGLNEAIREQDRLHPNELSDKKIYPNFRHFNPADYVDDEDAKHAGTGHYRDDAHFNRVIKAERIRNYNDVWQEANELIDGIMDAFDIRLGFVHECIGIPDKVQKALNGDEAAIAILKEEVAKIKKERAERVTRGEKERNNPNLPKRLSGMITNYVPMLFTAFVTGWMTVCMTLGHVGMKELQASVAQQQEIPARRASEGTPREVNMQITSETAETAIAVEVSVTRDVPSLAGIHLVSPRSMTGGGSREVDIHLATTRIARCVDSPHASPPVTDRGLSGLFLRSG
jgi:hypothetical protein